MIIVWGSELAYAGAGRPLIFGGGMSGGSTVTPNTQRGNIDYDQIRGASRAGNGNKFQMLAPSGFVVGHVPEWDADGNIFDSGTTPGGGGITQLTADVTAGPGTGSQAATVVATHLTAPLPVNQGGTGTASTLTGVVRGGSPLTATELSGDVVTSGSNATTIQANAITTSKINNAAVTYAKIQNVSANSVLLGAGATGSGAAPVEIALGAGLTMTGTTLSSSGGTTPAIVLISEVVTAGTQASVTFSTISASYRDLIIRIRGRCTGAAVEENLVIQFNGDTGANYSYEQVQSFSTGTLFQQATAQTSIAMAQLTAGTATANHAGGCEITVFDYRGTTFFKCAMSQFGASLGTGTFTQGAGVGSGQWLNTAAITSIVVFWGAGSFVNGSVVSLYGSL